jgi:hypothetical protein
MEMCQRILASLCKICHKVLKDIGNPLSNLSESLGNLHIKDSWRRSVYNFTITITTVVLYLGNQVTFWWAVFVLSTMDTNDSDKVFRYLCPTIFLAIRVIRCDVFHRKIFPIFNLKNSDDEKRNILPENLLIRKYYLWYSMMSLYSYEINFTYLIFQLFTFFTEEN